MCEILAPAGNEECALAAIRAGANAVYLGFSAFSARANAGNFNESALENIVKQAHFLNVKVYVAMNTLVKDSETESFIQTLLAVWKTGADAIIMQDALLGREIHARYPEIVLHLSTQAGVCSAAGARFAKECGFSRVILARETPLAEIGKIAKIIETESFVQGALCTAFSGQCYFSSFAGGNSGNRGRCKQPCRKKYKIDRKGFEEYLYALSLSDLCVGESVEKYLEAGVSSLKIEGRMRRAEYVAAAVKYYRSLLEKAETRQTERALSDLKRTYNRGNYTKGLAFGQDKRLLSQSVQGHIGEKVGVVKVINGKYRVESRFTPQKGDSFKILRAGKEVGGATYEKSERQGFVISSKTRLLNGDGVFVTTDSSANARALEGEKKIPVALSLRFALNERATAEGNGACVCSNEILSAAQSSPLTEEDVKNCFFKTDGLPVDVRFEKIEISGDVFFAKSRLNAFRRAFYEKLFSLRTQTERTDYAFDFSAFSIAPSKAACRGKIAVISSDFSFLSGGNANKNANKSAGGKKIDVAVYKPNDYGAELDPAFLAGDFEKYIYYPAFTSEADREAIKETVKKHRLSGVYAENYAGAAFARENGFGLFAGAGFNLTNQIAVSGLLKHETPDYFTVSKELDEREQRALCLLAPEKSALIESGDVKLMDLYYCPFGKTCAECDKKPVYTLTDEDGRKFPLRRYKSAAGDCRFEVYNCAELVGAGGASGAAFVGGVKTLDLSVFAARSEALEAIESEAAQKELYQNYTSGHRKNSVL